jgi:hypothetical protein
VLLIVGSLYWFAVQRHKGEMQQMPPATAVRGPGMRPAR